MVGKPTLIKSIKDGDMLNLTLSEENVKVWQQSYLLFCKGVTEGSSNVSYTRRRNKKQIIYGKLRNLQQGQKCATRSS